MVRRTRGFTLIEMIVATVVTAIIGSLAASLLMEASRVRTGAAIRVELLDQTARSMEQMIRFIREIAQDAGLTGKAQIASANTSTLTFGTYGFRKNGADIEMSTDSQATWHAMTRDATSLTFRYYVANGTELTPAPLTLAQRESVRQISIELQLARANEAAQLRTRVYLRSFLNEAN